MTPPLKQHAVEGEHTPVISLGAGVQSSVLLLMAARGELDEISDTRPELAIFADTQWEEAATYEWLGLLRIEAWRGGIEIIQGSAGDLRADVLEASEGGRSRASQPPMFTRGKDDRPQITPRKCTRDYKVRVIRRVLRERGLSEANPVEQWIGISREEAVERQKPSDVAWVKNRWPLVEIEMSRWDCERWLLAHGYPVPPKSSCVGCPYHTDAYWRAMKLERPAAFADAVDFDLRIRHMPGMNGETFLHRSLLPLGEVDFRNAEDRGQLVLGDGFGGECEGMCGV
jgi:hypothetical protein